MSDVVICNTYPINAKWTLAILKPDAVRRELVETIIDKLRDQGFSLLAKKEKKLSRDEVKSIYKKTFERDFPSGADDTRAKKSIDYMTSGTSVGLLIRHETVQKPELFKFIKEKKGLSWVPDNCSPESIRYQLRDKTFDGYSPQFTDGFLVGPFPQNLIHTVETEEELISAYEIFFKGFTEKTIYIPPKSAENREFKVDILFCITYSNSSSDKMRIKMHSGVTHLCSYLNKQNYHTIIKGFSNEPLDTIISEIESVSPKYIAFSPVSSEFGFVSKISKLLREKNPSIIQIGGGPHFTIFPQDMISSNIDAVCVGEGELPLLDLLSGKPIKSSPGWVYREGPQLIWSNAQNSFIKNISQLPIADHSLWDSYEEQKNYSHRRILVSRGCPYNCTYCSNRKIKSASKGKYVRYRSPNNIEDELLFILEKYPQVENIFLESEIFHPKLGLDEKVFDITKKYMDKVNFGTNLRIGIFNKEYLQKMQNCGFTFAYVGIESGNEEIRRKILHRYYTNQDAIKIFHAAKDMNFNLNSYNLVGLPDETIEKFEDTIALNLECQPNEAQLSIFFPYPGTELYYTCLDRGYIKSPFFHHKFTGYERRVSVLNIPDFPENEILDSYAKFRSIFG